MYKNNKHVYKSPNSGLYFFKKMMEPFSDFINSGKTKRIRSAREMVILDLYTDILEIENQPEVKDDGRKKKRRRKKSKNNFLHQKVS